MPAAIVLFVFAFQLLLVSAELMPTYIGLNAFDEAKYIESGRLLLQGEVRNLPWGPLVALVYAPLHLVLGDSPNWFLLEARAGQVILFAGLWFSTYYLARQFRDHANRFVVLGTLFVSTGLFDVLANQSDAVFVTFSALSLAKVIQYRRRRGLKEVVLASAFLSLAVLSRLEGALLLAVLLVAVIYYGRTRELGRVAVAFLVPLGLVLGGYLLVSPSRSIVSAGSKAYTAFQANQPIPGGARVEQRIARAQELFGTAEENNGSVLRAALRNPAAFINRIFLSALRIPEFYLVAFNRRLGPALLLLSLWGVYVLLRRRAFGLLAILALWSLQPMVSLLFLPLHLVRQLIYLPHILAAIAVTSIAAGSARGFEKWLPLALVLGLGIYGLADNKLAFLVTAVVLSGPLLIQQILARRDVEGRETITLLMMLFLAAGLMLRGPYSFPNYPPVGQSDQERVVHYLQEELPPDSRILEGLPLPAVAAKLVNIHPSNVPAEVTSPEAFHDWLIRHEIKAIYLGDHVGLGSGPSDLLREGVGEYFELGFSTEDGSQQVFLVSGSR